MAKYLLDTGILLGYVKGANYAEYVERTFGVMKVENISCISVVTAGRYVIAEYGEKRLMDCGLRIRLKCCVINNG